MVCGLESPQLMRGASGGRRSLIYQPRPTSRGGNMSIESQLIEPLRGPVTVFLRLALGIAFLSAVGDPLGPLGIPRHEERRLGRLRSLHAVHGAAQSMGTSRAHPNARLALHRGRAAPR